MNNLLRKGFQAVSETEMMMVEGGEPRNAPSSGGYDPDRLHVGGGNGGGGKPIFISSGILLPDPHADEK